MVEIDILKEQLLELIEALEEDEGIELDKEFPLFKWSYPERPHIQFQLLIKELDEVPTKDTVH